MKYLPLIFIVCVILLLSLTGCQAVADFYDSQDPCQTDNPPSWCGASDRIYIYDIYGQPVGYIE